MDDDEDDYGGALGKLRCKMCGSIGLEESDGYYYCRECGAQDNDIIATGVADEDLMEKDGGGAGGGGHYSVRNIRHSQQPLRSSQIDLSSQVWIRFTQEDDVEVRVDGSQSQNAIESEIGYDYLVGPTDPEDFGSGAIEELKTEDYYNEIRFRYVMGMQWMIQLQCAALVEKFRVNPMVCGIAGSVWLRFVAASGVFKDSWADDVFTESEVQSGKLLEDARQAVMVWFRQLKKTIPLSSSLAICFLACHVAREAILPTDIVEWSIEGKLPYFTAHFEIDRRFGRPSPACPISSSLMFRPYQTVPLQKLESMAASIAQSIGLQLPPVNFYAIASRYLRQLSLPVKEILPHACRIYEWSMPPDVYLSSNESKLPTRVSVLSILIVAIRILYDINGFGVWEKSLSSDNDSFSHSQDMARSEPVFSSAMKADNEDCSGSPTAKLVDLVEESAKSSSFIHKSESETAELLCNLEASYDQIGKTLEHTKDLPSYLQYCKDVVFAGVGASNMDDYEEEQLIKRLWDFYLNEKEAESLEELEDNSRACFNEKRLHGHNGFINNSPRNKKIRKGIQKGPIDDFRSHHAEDTPQKSGEEVDSSDVSEKEEEPSNTAKDRAIRQLKLDMEENRFCYIPPRVNIKRLDYLHYVRKNKEGAFTYAAHADYYILLRVCARVAEVDIRIMHIGVLSFERRLAWLEKRIDHCLQLTPPSLTCDFCEHVTEDETIGLSQLSL